jgi:hypothetical protein
MKRYHVHQVGVAEHTERWILAEDVEEMNTNIVGLIALTGEFHS